MIFKSKFNLHQRVYIIRHQPQKITKKCEACLSTGKIVTQTNLVMGCPKCWGNPLYTRLPAKWIVANPEKPYAIGQIRGKVDFSQKPQYKYMLEETGIGSGTLWAQDLLYDNIEKAQKECDRRNNS